MYTLAFNHLEGLHCSVVFFILLFQVDLYNLEVINTLKYSLLLQFHVAFIWVNIKFSFYHYRSLPPPPHTHILYSFIHSLSVSYFLFVCLLVCNVINLDRKRLFMTEILTANIKKSKEWKIATCVNVRLWVGVSMLVGVHEYS